jgi:hypothetical protein
MSGPKYIECDSKNFVPTESDASTKTGGNHHGKRGEPQTAGALKIPSHRNARFLWSSRDPWLAVGVDLGPF